MAKKVSKWFRIGVEGDTCDGRVINGDDIQDMADTFDPRVYGWPQVMTRWPMCLPMISTAKACAVSTISAPSAP